MKLVNAFLKRYRSDKIFLAEWLLAIVTGAFVFVTSSTWDLQSLTQWSVNFWHVLFGEGGIRNFYEYTAENVWKVHHVHMGSELMSVLPWSIWNLPLFFIEKFTGNAIVGSATMLAYSKFFLVIITVITIIFTKKVTVQITGDKNKGVWAAFLSASSLYIFISVCYSGQNEIFMICASIIAIYCLFNNKTKWFIFWSALTISIKPFFVLAYLAVLLLLEKKIYKIFYKLLIGVSGMIVQKAFFNGAPDYEESMNTGPARQMLEDMFPSNMSTAFGPISFFAILLVLTYIYAYSRDFSFDSLKNSDPVRTKKYVIYIICLVYMNYVMFSPFSFYRVDVLVPFLFILIVQNDKMVFYNGVFDFAMELSLMIKFILRGSKIFQIRFVNKSLVQRLLGYTVKYEDEGKYMNIANFAMEKNDLIASFSPMFSGIAVICGILLLVFNHPDDKYTLKIGAEKRCRALLWLRTVIILPFALLCIYLFTMAPDRVYS